MANGTEFFSGRCVLVVEDEYLIATDLADLLRSYGAHVIGPAGHVAAALELVKTTPRIDAALLNVRLSSDFSYSVADALLTRRIPVAFLTGLYDLAVLPDRFTCVPRFEKHPNLGAVAIALLQ